MLKSISILELLPNIDKVKLIDIRSVAKYNDNHIPNAININSENLVANPSKYINKNEKYYLYCQKGITSKKIVQILNVKGYNVVNIQGGYESWLLEK